MIRCCLARLLDHPNVEQSLMSPEEVALIGRWIDEGAKYQQHWAFQPLQKPDVPEVAHRAWPRNDIDRFILARIEKAGLEPSAEADRRTLMRRLSFVLIGLPPTPEEVDAFVNDPDIHCEKRP